MADEWTRGKPADELLGITLANCRIESLIGEGGMARVYRAHQSHLERDVALKVLPPHYGADPAFVERFKLEARAMGRLSHPHIVTVHDSGEDRGLLYIIMEYVNGPNLRQRILGGLTLEETARIITQVGGALTFAHEHGIVHRDVKPQNVLLDASGWARLSDFGIAKVFAASDRLTLVGAGVGTPEYMSPEQCKGGPVDARSDIYALGAMLYEMLTGRPPFIADNYTAIAHSQIYERPVPPSRLNPRISPAVQAVVLKALEKVPGDRFQQATDMADTLELAVASQTPMARPSSPSAPARSTGRVAATVICPRCSAPNAAHQRFCSSCGQPFAPGKASGGAMPVSPAPTGWASCPTCGYANQPLNHFCTQCGTPLVPALVECRGCGATNAAGVRFCTACGRPLS